MTCNINFSKHRVVPSAMLCLSLWIFLACCQGSYYFANGELQAIAAERHSRVLGDTGRGPALRAERASRQRRQGEKKTAYTISGRERLAVTQGTCICSACNDSEKAYQIGDFENVVYNKKATASSGSPCAATNGVISASEKMQSFLSKEQDLVPWMIVDLNNAFSFDQFTLYRLYEDSEDRFLGVDVLVDGRLVHAFPKYSEANSLPKLNTLDMTINMTEPETGRYFTLQRREGDTDSARSGSHRLLINEIAIWVCKPNTWGNRDTGCQECPTDCAYACDNYFGCKKVLFNVALRRPTHQNYDGIPEKNHGTKDNIVDGRMAGELPKTCFVVKAPESYEIYIVWWVDLADSYMIDHVYITARKDCCGPENLKDFWVLVLDDVLNVDIKKVVENGQDCYYHEQGIETTTRVRLSCVGEKMGSFVALYANGKVLGLCEFEAFGYRIFEIPIGDSCDPNSKIAFCGENTPGVGGVCEKNYCRKQAGVGGCTMDEECVSDTVCDATHQCSIPVGSSCKEQKDTLCVFGADCVDGECKCKQKNTDSSCDILPGKVGGECRVGHCDDRQAECTSHGQCHCKEGFAADHSTLACRTKLGGRCKADSDCTEKATCEEKGVCSLPVGQSCVGERKKYCRTGSICDEDKTCRVDLHESCLNATDGCRRNTACDVFMMCKRRPGRRCREDSDCMAGSACSSSDSSSDKVCDCREGVSTLSEDICKPVEGKFGSSCTKSCGTPNSQCVREVCSCLDGYQATWNFECVSQTARAEDEDTVPWLGIVLAIMGLILILAALVLGTIARRQKPATGADDAEQRKNDKGLNQGAGAGSHPLGPATTSSQAKPTTKPPTKGSKSKPILKAKAKAKPILKAVPVAKAKPAPKEMSMSETDLSTDFSTDNVSMASYQPLSQAKRVPECPAYPRRDSTMNTETQCDFSTTDLSQTETSYSAYPESEAYPTFDEVSGSWLEPLPKYAPSCAKDQPDLVVADNVSISSDANIVTAVMYH